MTKQISLKELKQDVENGMKRNELKKKYTDGNNSALTGLLKAAGLKIKKTQLKKYELVNDLGEDSGNLQDSEVQDSGFTKAEETAMFAEAEEMKLGKVEEEY